MRRERGRYNPAAEATAQGRFDGEADSPRRNV